MYTDPDGEFINYIIGAVVGFINGLSQGAQIANAKGLTGGAKFGYMMAGAGIGGALGLASAGFGALITNAVNVSGALGGMITGAITGPISGGTSALAMGALAGMKGDDLLNAFGKGTWQGLLSGVVMGGAMGAIDAAVAGKNPWNGGLTLKDKLAILVEKDKTLLDSQFGESEISGVHLANRKNLAELKSKYNIDYRRWDGNAINPEGLESNSFYLKGYKDVTPEGNDCWFNNEIYVSKNAVRDMWNGKTNALGTLGHEWRHSRLLYTGEHAQMINVYGENYLEFNVHKLTDYFYPTNSRLNIINYYGGLLGFPKIFR